MKIAVEEGEAGWIIHLEGVLDFSASGDFRHLVDMLAVRGRGSVVFDLSRVTRIDSVGLGLLHIAREELAAPGWRVRLASPIHGVSRMLSLTQAENDFDICP